VSVAEVDIGPITSVAPFAGADVTVAPGLPFPAPNQSIAANGARCIWIGQGEALLTGVAPDPALGDIAAVVDQSDAWAVVTLTGADGPQVLARLVPVDLRLSAFGVGATRRSQLGHMNASLTRLEEDVILIAVFRSMAGTLVHELARALEAVAARQ